VSRAFYSGFILTFYCRRAVPIKHAKGHPPHSESVDFCSPSLLAHAKERFEVDRGSLYDPRAYTTSVQVVIIPALGARHAAPGNPPKARPRFNPLGDVNKRSRGIQLTRTADVTAFLRLCCCAAPRRAEYSRRDSQRVEGSVPLRPRACAGFLRGEKKKRKGARSLPVRKSEILAIIRTTDIRSYNERCRSTRRDFRAAKAPISAPIGHSSYRLVKNANWLYW
jgi:hypothetical protein